MTGVTLERLIELAQMRGLSVDFEWQNIAEKRLVVGVLLEAQNGMCWFCGEPLEEARYPHPRATTIEHLIPKRIGGISTIRNIRLAHKLCNNKAAIDWRREAQATGLSVEQLRERERQNFADQIEVMWRGYFSARG